jgi:hypothetical protein
MGWLWAFMNCKCLAERVMWCCLLSACLLGPAFPAWACRPAEGDVFDDIPSVGFVAAIAEVTDVTITKSSATQSCFAVSYHLSELLYGKINDTFRIETCGNDGPITEEDLTSTPDEYGFSEGATVLVGVITPKDGTLGLRYAVPDCWGPWHLRLDGMDAVESKAFIDDIRKVLSDAKTTDEP